jgi:chemotaxis protein histidine kinase CheA
MIKVEGIAGATDLGDGRVVLILNLHALARAAKTAIRTNAGTQTHDATPARSA